MNRRDIPNQLTLGRVALTALCLALLQAHQYPDGPACTLWAANAVFILAAASDWLDGYLARRWQVESTFGRIMDPFADKVLVLGTLLMLAGPGFHDPQNHTVVSGVAPWMVAIILARELLVTGIRGEMERRGVKFGAQWVGKVKTTLQTVGIPVILAAVTLRETHPITAHIPPIVAWALTLFTAYSGWPYVRQAIRETRSAS